MQGKGEIGKGKTPLKDSNNTPVVKVDNTIHFTQLKLYSENVCMMVYNCCVRMKSSCLLAFPATNAIVILLPRSLPRFALLAPHLSQARPPRESRVQMLPMLWAA